MSERDNNPTGDRFAAAQPVEARIGADGTPSVVVRVVATDKEMAQDLTRIIEETTGWVSQDVPETENGRSNFFFSSSTWHAPWKPKGPEPNWRTPPKDPRLN